MQTLTAVFSLLQFYVWRTVQLPGCEAEAKGCHHHPLPHHPRQVKLCIQRENLSFIPLSLFKDWTLKFSSWLRDSLWIFKVVESRDMLSIFIFVPTLKLMFCLCVCFRYIIVVEHDLSVLDYLSDFICCLYGVPSAYGVVTMPFSVREGKPKMTQNTSAQRTHSR